MTTHLLGLRVLLLEDSQADAELSAELLHEALPDASLQVVRRLSEAVEAVADASFDVALVDLSLPDADDAQAVLALRAACPQTALVVLTGTHADDLVHRLLTAGAQDYLVKGTLTADALRRAVRYAASRARAEEQLRRSQAWAQSVLDAVEAPTCAVDADGVVVAVNAAWDDVRRCAGAAPGCSGIGTNYLEVCDRTLADPHATASETGVAEHVATGLRRLLSSGQGWLELEYPCHGPEGLRWFSLRATPAAGGGGAVLTHTEVTALRRAHDQLAHTALHDPLTGLPNRMRLDGELARRLAVREPGASVAVLFVDLDLFKLVNDSYGHAAGDGLLVEVAGALQAAVRADDVVARHSGDEFVVVAAVAGDDEAVALADRVQDATCRTFVVDGHEVVVSCSQGLAVAAPGWQGKADELLVAADAAMHEAKAKGRGRVEVFDVDLRERARTRAGLHRELLSALEHDELEVHYQPVVDVVARQVVTVEALVRWRHPSRGLLLPGAFLDVAESSGLIVPIGTSVLRQACRQGAAWQAQGLPLRVAVNLSARQLVHADVLPAIAEALVSSGLPPGSLMVEVTETAVIEDTDRALRALESLKGLGVGIAVDDFGTGWSSLAYLQRYPVDVVKVDRCFVRDVVTSADDRSIVQSIVTLARELDLRVVVEGVETRDQVDVLSAMGCRLLQGFAFSPAVEAAQVLALVERLTASQIPDLRPPVSPVALSRGVDRRAVLRVRALQAQGASQHTIAAALNVEGILTPQGLRWHARSVARYLEGEDGAVAPA